MIISWVFSSQNDSVQPSGLLPYTQLYVPGNSPTWQSIPYATFQSGYQAGFTATGIVGTDVLTVGSLPPVTQYVGVMWYDKPVMVSRFLSISCPFPNVSRYLKHVSAISLPKHAPLLIALTERRNADFEKDSQQIQGILGLGISSDNTTGSQYPYIHYFNCRADSSSIADPLCASQLWGHLVSST